MREDLQSLTEKSHEIGGRGLPFHLEYILKLQGQPEVIQPIAEGSWTTNERTMTIRGYSRATA